MRAPVRRRFGAAPVMGRFSRAMTGPARIPGAQATLDTAGAAQRRRSLRHRRATLGPLSHGPLTLALALLGAATPCLGSGLGPAWSTATGQEPTAATEAGRYLSVDCAACHTPQAEQLGASVHHAAVRCPECHGGEWEYALTFEQRRQYLSESATQPSPAPRPAFDHGESFRGKTPRAGVPELCGTCHSDIERMNPYGLRTDQLAGYWVSGHGKRLRLFGDDRVAVCTDCHGSHDTLSKENAHSRTYFRNIPDTCGRCHADPELMGAYSLPAEIVPQYRASIHGRNVLERGDAGSPNCATCHGSHAAAPPGVAEVGHVCGQCHRQVEEYLLASVHGRIAVLARCTGCHGPGGDPRNHQIEKATPPPQMLVDAYAALRAQSAGDPAGLQVRFVEQVDSLPVGLRFDQVCWNCHGPGRSGAHAEFFRSSDQAARERGQELTAVLRAAQFAYARTAERVARISRGVLLVRDEAVRAEDARTELMALQTFMHTVNRAEIVDRSEKVKAICQEIDASLEQKETELAWRTRALLPVWAFLALFAAMMYRKYTLLRAAHVRPAEVPLPVLPSPGRRRMLDLSLRVLGAATCLALLWPAVVYVLPARKRGGGSETVGVGKAEGWEVWDARKVAVAGKPVVVVRVEDGFRAFSLVCTHLGCIVRWNRERREFECPCHAAHFDANGQVVSGPPPRPLAQYAVNVAQGEVIVKGSGAG